MRKGCNHYSPGATGVRFHLISLRRFDTFLMLMVLGWLKKWMSAPLYPGGALGRPPANTPKRGLIHPMSLRHEIFTRARYHVQHQENNKTYQNTWGKTLVRPPVSPPPHPQKGVDLPHKPQVYPMSLRDEIQPKRKFDIYWSRKHRSLLNLLVETLPLDPKLYCTAGTQI